MDIVIEESCKEVWTTDVSQCLFDASAFLGAVPEEEHSLGLLLGWGASAEHGLHCVGVITSCPHRRSCGHGCGCEVLHLLQLKIQLLGFYGKSGHIFLPATRMGTDEVWDDLLVQSCLAINLVESAFEGVEESEGRFAHE